MFSTLTSPEIQPFEPKSDPEYESHQQEKPQQQRFDTDVWDSCKSYKAD